MSRTEPHILGSSSCFCKKLAKQIAREYYSHHTNSTPCISVYSSSKITHVCPTYLFPTSPPGKTDDCLCTRMLGGGRRRRGHRMGFGVREKFWTCVCQGGFSLPPFPSSSILVGIHVLPLPFLPTPSYRPYLFDFSSTPLGHTNHPWKNAPRENQIISRKTSVSENAPINFPS